MPPESGIEMRVFVVGVPRSGTTLVQSLLATHSTATSFTESHFFSRHYALLPLLGTPILTRDPGPRLREFLAENHEPPPAAIDWFDTMGRGARGGRVLLPCQTRPAARQFLKVLDEVARRRGRSCWIEKTPRHLRYLPLVEKVSGADSRTRFVHVIRQGLDVVASLHEASRSWELRYDLDACVRRWNADVGFSLSRIGAPSDLFVFYEELTARPERTLRRLLEGLGLGWEPEILEEFGHTSGRLITSEEEWKNGVDRAIRRSPNSGRSLEDGEQERVIGSLEPGLYERILESASRRSGESEGAC
jgi:hypothetical protein